jgi:hypothetical protein
VVELTQAAMWHRQVAALADAAQRAGVGPEHLPTVRARLRNQQSWFAAAASRTGVAMPALAPSPTEVAASAPALGDLSAATVAETFRLSHSTLDAVDAALGVHGPTGAFAGPTPVPALRPPGSVVPAGPPLAAAGPVPAATGVATWPSPGRNALVYGAYSLAVLIIQVVLFVVADEQAQLPLLAPLCLFVLPAFAWAAGWFTVGVVFRPLPGANSVKRTPRLGVAICLLPNLLLCAGLGVLFAANRLGS